MPKGIYKHKPHQGFQKGHSGFGGGFRTGTYKHTEESKKKIGLALKGRKQSKEQRKKLSEYLTGRPSSIKGKHTWSLESRIRFSKKMRGKNGNNWQDGKKPINKRIRMGIEFRLWREAVFARDNWTCQKTKIRGGSLHPHHIQNFVQYPELRFAIDNGITLSKKAHEEFHKKYGQLNNTKEQLDEFLS